MGHEPVERVGGHELDAGDFIDAFARQSGESAFHRRHVTWVAKAERFADPLALAVDEDVLRSPCVQADTRHVSPGFSSRGANAGQELAPDAFRVPDNVPVALFVGVGEAIDPAHGAAFAGYHAGSLGDAAAFSFYFSKNLGGYGEGGFIMTNDDELARRVRMIRDHGQAKKYYHDMEGYNGRLDAIQAGLLGIKLKSLPEWNGKRRHNASLYSNLFQTLHPTPNTLLPPYVPDWSKPVFHLYIARVPQREKLQAYLNENGIGTGLHYPVPVHLQKAYAGNGYKEGDYPITEMVSSEILSLPMFPELTEEQINYVVNKIMEFYKTNPVS